MKRDKWVPNKWSFLCSDHFKESDYKVGKGLKRRLKPDAIPSLFNFPNCRKPNKGRRQLNYKLSHVEVSIVCQFLLKY